MEFLPARLDLMGATVPFEAFLPLFDEKGLAGCVAYEREALDE
jgi:hypothetical protein